MFARLLVALIRLYQATLSKAILALAGPVCRFQPSCSRYAIACIQGHGALRGSLLSVRRLCRCHPLNPGGFDPPPPRPPGPRSGGLSTSSAPTAAPITAHLLSDAPAQGGRPAHSSDGGTSRPRFGQRDGRGRA